MSFYLTNIGNIFEVTKVTIKIFTIFFTIIKLKQLRVLRSPETGHTSKGYKSKLSRTCTDISGKSLELTAN